MNQVEEKVKTLSVIDLGLRELTELKSLGDVPFLKKYVPLTQALISLQEKGLVVCHENGWYRSEEGNRLIGSGVEVVTEISAVSPKRAKKDESQLKEKERMKEELKMLSGQIAALTSEMRKLISANAETNSSLLHNSNVAGHRLEGIASELKNVSTALRDQSILIKDAMNATKAEQPEIIGKMGGEKGNKPVKVKTIEPVATATARVEHKQTGRPARVKKPSKAVDQAVSPAAAELMAKFVAALKEKKTTTQFLTTNKAKVQELVDKGELSGRSMAAMTGVAQTTLRDAFKRIGISLLHAKASAR